jgi:hypothetical protein
MTLSPDHVFVIGVGGTGGHIAAPLARLIAYHSTTENTKVTFIDGDSFEESNQNRQLVGAQQMGKNKAEAMVDLCKYQGLNNVDYIDDFISMTTFIPLLNRCERPLVVCSVDNDATRKNVIDALLSVNKANFFFITPGNSDGFETVRGQTMWFGAVDGVPYGLNPALAYESIENPTDSIPEKGSCALNAPSRPQLISANFMAASITLAAIQNILDGLLNPQKNSMFFNLRTFVTSIS